MPILVESHEGRPTRIEGNPKLSATGGATDARAQAAILELYDPDRSGAVLRRNGERTEAASWEAFDRFADAHFAGLRSARGRGLRFLSGSDDSPALDLLRDHLRKTMPEARWHVHEPIGDDQIRAGAALAFGPGPASMRLTFTSQAISTTVRDRPDRQG